MMPLSAAALSILAYARTQYGTDPDLPFPADDITRVLRRADTGKWYAILMYVPRARLGLSGEGSAWVMNLKVDPILLGSLLALPGFLPAYHMNKSHRLTVLPDEVADPALIRSLLDRSYALTAPGKRTIGRQVPPTPDQKGAEPCPRS